MLAPTPRPNPGMHMHDAEHAHTCVPSSKAGGHDDLLMKVCTLCIKQLPPKAKVYQFFEAWGGKFFSAFAPAVSTSTECELK